MWRRKKWKREGQKKPPRKNDDNSEVITSRVCDCTALRTCCSDEWGQAEVCRFGTCAKFSFGTKVMYNFGNHVNLLRSVAVLEHGCDSPLMQQDALRCFLHRNLTARRKATMELPEEEKWTYRFYWQARLHLTCHLACPLSRPAGTLLTTAFADPSSPLHAEAELSDLCELPCWCCTVQPYAYVRVES